MRKRVVLLSFMLLFATFGIFAQSKWEKFTNDCVQHAKVMEQYAKQVEKSPQSGSINYFNQLLDIQIGLVQRLESMSGYPTEEQERRLANAFAIMQDALPRIQRLSKYFR